MYINEGKVKLALFSMKDNALPSQAAVFKTGGRKIQWQDDFQAEVFLKTISHCSDQIR